MNIVKTLLADKSFWAALVSIVSCICVAANVPEGSITQITSFIGGLGAIIAYIISNGIQEAAAIEARSRENAAKIQLEAEKVRRGAGDTNGAA